MLFVFILHGVFSQPLPVLDLNAKKLALILKIEIFQAPSPLSNWRNHWVGYFTEMRNVDGTNLFTYIRSGPVTMYLFDRKSGKET